MFDKDNLQNLIGQAQQVQENMLKGLDKMAVRGTAGGGMVTVVVNGHKEVTKVEFGEGATQNLTLLADMVLAALGSAYSQLDKERSNNPPNFASLLDQINISDIMDQFKK